MHINMEQIRELLSVVSATEVTELTIEFGDQRITVKKAPPVTIEAAPKPIATKSFEVERTVSPQAPAAVAVAPAPAAVAPVAAPEPEKATNGYIEITSPMVGTFYRSPSPDSQPYISVGDHVREGQTVCIIEAMKLMNDMPSEVTGKVIKILVDNGTTVEYGQPLFLVDPKG